MLECTLCKARVKVNINFTLVSIFSWGAVMLVYNII